VGIGEEGAKSAAVINFGTTNSIGMAKKIAGGLGGLVYSTDKNYMSQLTDDQQEAETLPKEQQKLRVRLDTKQRAGKTVTVIEGFSGKEDDVEALSKQLKTKCGTGGSVKDGVILIQGDYKEKVVGWLKEWGYKQTK
jgi:translation initiation factor 1